MKIITTHYIDDEFVKSHGKEVRAIVRPVDGQIIGRVTLADEEDTRRGAWFFSGRNLCVDWLERRAI
jgi:hypothetical protein